MPVTISPAILGANGRDLGMAVQQAELAGANSIHFDIMDGRFVRKFSFGQTIIRDLRALTRLPFEVHLQVEDPGRHIKSFVESGADWISVHFEACIELPQVLHDIRSRGCRAGIAVNPATKISSLTSFIPSIDFVIVMTAEPGTSAFIPSTLDKLTTLRQLVDNMECGDVIIQADGGITEKTARLTIAAGAQSIAAASAVFGHPLGIAEGIQSLRRSIDSP